MNDRVKTKTIKQIKIDVNKCIGCRACELACAAFHSTPKYSRINPAMSRIRVMVDEFNDVYFPVRAGEYTSAECNGRYTYTINGKEYRECGFCKVACPSRDKFKEPDSGLPLKCDMCESEPPLKEPWCVKVCGSNALTYEERELDVGEEKVKPKEVVIGLESLADKYGMKQIMDAIARMSKKAEH